MDATTQEMLTSAITRRERAYYKEQAAKREKEEANQLIRDIFELEGLERADDPEHGTVTLTKATERKKLNMDEFKHELVKAGLSADELMDIESRCTTVTTGTPSLRYTPVKSNG